MFTNDTYNAGTANEERAVLLSNFWRNREMPLEANCVIWKAYRATTFIVTDTNFYVPVVSQSTQTNTKLLKQLKLGFKSIIFSSKYQSKLSTQAQLYINK